VKEGQIGTLGSKERRRIASLPLPAGALKENARRSRPLAAYHLFEIGSAASQLAIVLASAAIITGVTLLVYMAGALGIVGIGFGVIAWLAPTMLHL
jgi:hypothetical protein